MKIHRITINNFRNFKNFEVYFGDTAVIVGENKVGKSNFLFALRLVLDPSLPDTARHLQNSDFWDGLPRPLTKDDVITISIELTDFEHNEDLMALLGEHLVHPEPMVSRLTYVYQPLSTLDRSPATDVDYEFFIYGGDRTDNKIGYEIRRGIPLDVLPALRDAEGDLSSWNRSPLKPLLENVSKNIDRNELLTIADQITIATNLVRDIEQMRTLANGINDRITDMVGSPQAIQTEFGFSPTDPDRLIRAARLFIDNGRRGVGDASLGTANLLYLTLKTLELRQLVELGLREYTILAIEEPEAHLHPHLQRLIYRDFLKTRNQGIPNVDPSDLAKQLVLLTTHSPHIASVTPFRSLVILKKSANDGTIGVSTSQINLNDKEIADMERYLDVTRGELLFAKGVLLVEGDAEMFLIPELGKIMGYDFDKLGITVCSVSGTNFLPYVKLLCSKGLNIPFAVITDLDPQEGGAKCLGQTRVIKLLKETISQEELSAVQDENDLLPNAPLHGFFLNSNTLEIELYNSGLHAQICQTIIDLTENDAAKERAIGWLTAPTTINESRLLKDIEEIGKGRFAQRLASYLNDNVPSPSYIREAIEYVATRC